MLGFIFRFTRNFTSPQALVVLFKILVRPILERCHLRRNLQKKSDNWRPLASLAKVQHYHLYPTSRPNTLLKKKDMMDLLKYIPPIHHQYYKDFKTERRIDQVEPVSDDCIIYPE
ncbi:hypothetical protein J6590_082280 [Homalodisca vitripennis]|nr:hypothetical protein J6590_082280 [Homalodisca vitripennis]